MVLIALLIVGVVFAYISSKYQIFTPAPRIATRVFATDYTAAVVTIDVEQAGEKLGEMAAQELGWPSWFVEFVLPYECSVTVDVDLDSAQRTITSVASMRRMGPLAIVALQDDELFDLGESLTQTGLIAERGALVTRAWGPIPDESIAFVREGWPQEQYPPQSGEGGHLLEVVIDNRNGQALLGLEGLGAMMAAADAEENDEPALPERQDIFNARELSGLFYRARTAHLTADFAGPDVLGVTAEIECADPLAARTFEFALLTVRDLLFKKLLQAGVVLEGDPVADGTTVRMDVTVTGSMKAFEAMVKAETADAPQPLKEEANG